jgi:hypothetical protein
MKKDTISEQRRQLIGLFGNALDGFTENQYEEILKIGNFLQTSLVNLINKYLYVDNLFGQPVCQFKLSVPLDYDNDTRIDYTIEKAKEEKSTLYCNTDFNSKNFIKSIIKLIPGKTYLVEFIPVLSQATNEDCFVFFEKRKVILVGGPGLALVYDFKKNDFPLDTYLFSFDKKDSLWKDAAGNSKVPSIRRHPNGGFSFRLDSFNGSLGNGDCLLCIYES